MNGTIFDEVKKNSQNKKKEKLKFLTALIFSNIFIAVLVLQFTEKQTPQLIPQILQTKKIHKDYKMLILPLNVMIETNSDSSEIPVSLINEQKKIIIKKAYLHTKISSNQNSDLINKISQFKIEINQNDLPKLASEFSENLIAIPEIQETKEKTKTISKGKSKYEISI